VIRNIMLCALAALALFAARPAFACSLVSLEPNERQHMLTTCSRLPDNDRSLCNRVVDDSNVVANYKRSCLEAMTLLLKGTAWSIVRGMPAAATCRVGLARDG
jgi:hypothetical protein